MKSVHLPIFEPLPQLPGPVSQPLIGEAAVLNNEAAVRGQIQGDRAREVQATVEQLQATLPDPRSTSLGKRLMRAALRAPFSSRAERAELTTWLNDVTPSGYEDAIRSHREDKARLQQDAQAKDIEGLALVMETRDELAREYGAHHNKKINAYLEREAPPIFHDWKARAEANGGQKLTWVEWLSREPDIAVLPQDATSATNQQFLNMLQWNVNRVRGLNTDPEVQREIETYKVRTEQALAAAVANGQLSPAVLERFQRTEGKAPIFMGDVFDPTLASANAYLATSKRHIVLGEVAELKTTVHEQLHATGGFANTFLDEGMTDKYTKVIMDTDAKLRGERPPGSDIYSYIWHTTALDDVLSLAQISDAESSQIYTGADEVENKIRLQALVKERLGVDFLGYTLDFYASEQKALYRGYVQEAIEAAGDSTAVAAIDSAKLARLADLADIGAARLASRETLSVWKEMAATKAPPKDIIERKIEALRQQQEAREVLS